MPAVKTIDLTIRGKRMQLEVPDRAPDEVPAPLEDLQLTIDMLCMALLALEDPRVDGVLQSFGFRIVNVDGDPIFDFRDDPA